MLIRHTKNAIDSYIGDLKDRPGEKGVTSEIKALEKLIKLFQGVLGIQFSEFKTIVETVSHSGLNQDSKGQDSPKISAAIVPLKRLLLLMQGISTANRIKDLNQLISLLEVHESASLSQFIHAVHSARRGFKGKRRPKMRIEELKSSLDNSLGNDEAFGIVFKEISLLSSEELSYVTSEILIGPSKTKNEALVRLQELHSSLRASHLKKRATGKRSAA